MIAEGQEFDRKSLRYALGKHRDLDGLGCDCVAFANATGGRILLGVEDEATEPPAAQRVPEDLLDRLRRSIPQLTVNVGIVVERKTASNGGEYVETRVAGNQQSIASTSDGRYFLRVADQTRRLLPDDLGRLLNERSSFVWELQSTKQVPQDRCDPGKRAALFEHVRASDRVSDFVKQKSDNELMEHYLFTKDRLLTNLGILWVGRREDRAGLLHAPIIQCIKYDEREQKVRKHVWADHDLNPLEMVEAVWREVPDWKETYEFPDGIFRKTVPHYEEVVVRELLANALAHRPYTQRGDIFINLYPDRLEVHNPGLLPIGVTPQNILHASSARNRHLAKIFYDLKLMETEGSGFDRMYQALLSSGRPAPEVSEGHDRVTVTVQKQIARPGIVDFMSKANKTYQPTQKELITLGLVAQHGPVTAIELERLLELAGADDLKHWLGRLRTWRLVNARGRTKGTEYYVDPDVLRRLRFKGPTTLKGIERPRLRELILRDLMIHRHSSRAEIHARIGKEIPVSKLRRALIELVVEGVVATEGETKARQYYLIATGPKTTL